MIALAFAGAFAVPSVSPAQVAVDRLELVMRSAVTRERDAIIGVRNTGDKTVQAIVRLEDWDRDADGTNRWYAYHTRPGSCGAALSLFPLAMSLDPGASQSLRVHLDSAQAPTTECWAAAVIETVQPTQHRQGIGYVLRTAVKIYVQPAGSILNGEIGALRVVATPRRPGADLEYCFTNTGTRHLEATGALEVRRPDNSVVARVNVPALYLLPGAQQQSRIALPALAKGRYVLLLTFDFGGDDIAAAQIEHIVP